MKRFPGLVLILALCTTPAWCQRWQLELFTGAAGYNGDLTQSSLQTRSLRPAVNVNVKYQLNDYVTLRAGLAYAAVAGHDKHNADSILRMRNLSFQTSIAEASICTEVILLPPDLFNSYPYLFAGVGVFRFNPFARDQNDNKVFLRPLRTEGQGLPQYPDRKEYNRTQFCIPFGVGVRFRINPQFSLSVEAGFRKLFTDYLDDVSTTYVDAVVLTDMVGPKAVEMMYRGDEVGGFYDPYPPYGSPRGNPDNNDWYYFGGLKIAWHFGKPVAKPERIDSIELRTGL